MNSELISLPGLLCCLAFFFAGVVDSITGGGGLITIPTMLAVGIPVHYITGTNQCESWLGTGAAAYKYVRSGNIHLKSALITLPFAVLGAYIGARLNLMVPDRYLKIFIVRVCDDALSTFVVFTLRAVAPGILPQRYRSGQGPRARPLRWWRCCYKQ